MDEKEKMGSVPKRGNSGKKMKVTCALLVINLVKIARMLRM